MHDEALPAQQLPQLPQVPRPKNRSLMSGQGSGLEMPTPFLMAFDTSGGIEASSEAGTAAPFFPRTHTTFTF